MSSLLYDAHHEICELEETIETKDKEIHDLKEQVASLQRALAHNRDRDSVVDS